MTFADSGFPEFESALAPALESTAPSEYMHAFDTYRLKVYYRRMGAEGDVLGGYWKGRLIVIAGVDRQGRILKFVGVEPSFVGKGYAMEMWHGLRTHYGEPKLSLAFNAILDESVYNPEE